MLLLNGPAQILRGVSDAETYYARLASAAARAQRAITPSVETLTAYVSEGRWVADCPHCASGIAVHPEWAAAHCLNCLRTFASIAVPPEWQAIERALVVRPERNQHCRFDEPVERLRWENLAHDLPEEAEVHS